MAEFPSAEWFDSLAAVANGRSAELADFGFSNIRLACQINGLPDGNHTYGLRIEGYEVISDGAIEPANWHPDCTLEGPAAIWYDMIANIRSHGAADLQHTLNALSLPEIPMRVVADDPMGRDLFFRYNQTLQEIFDLAAEVPTEMLAET
ncbi:MAG: hypothetical protein JJLCMIEE_01477 [Acidimicrobiales bacterium]|nr:MAG: hypothetical protein EDR02_06350 [Actinomycetota bacterium]MBV6508416.1 hypothetical protein [Acidimicrobiales bacterium]RIK04777.1 MAG: hypothetical protein DCC48_12045 [Acidobacteriota bacterium]